MYRLSYTCSPDDIILLFLLLHGMLIFSNCIMVSTLVLEGIEQKILCSLPC